MPARSPLLLLALLLASAGAVSVRRHTTNPDSVDASDASQVAEPVPPPTESQAADGVALERDATSPDSVSASDASQVPALAPSPTTVESQAAAVVAPESQATSPGSLNATDASQAPSPTTVQSQAATAVTPARPTVIHFMFELHDHLTHPEVWGRFFKDCYKGACMIWAHCTDHAACQKDYLMTLLNVKVVSTVYSQRGADLVTPFVHMMRNAMALTKDWSHLVSEKFVVISDSTLPAKPFKTVYEALSKHGDSDWCSATPMQWASAEIEGQHMALVKHHQWAVLNRADAQELALNWRFVPKLLQWNVKLKEGKWASNHSQVPRSSFAGGTWYTATDEEAPYAVINGAMPVPDHTSMAKQWEFFSKRVCHTYVAFPQDVEDMKHAQSAKASLLQLSNQPWAYNQGAVTLPLLEDKESRLVSQSGIWHPFTMEHLSDASLITLRRSPFLFARKFSPCAVMPNATAILLTMM